MRASERRIRQALADLIKQAQKTAESPTPAALNRLRLASANAAEVMQSTDPVQRPTPVSERRGPIGQHLEHGCGGAMYENYKGDRWVLWCDRCGYLPRIWRFRTYALKR